MKIIDDIDFWHNYIGAQTIPFNIGPGISNFNSKKNTNTFDWKLFQNRAMPTEFYKSYKKSGYFNKGVAVITGKIRG
jgi:hypothetical protein